MTKGCFKLTILLMVFSTTATQAFDCLELEKIFNGAPTQPKFLSEDFSYRDSLSQTEVPQKNWESCCGSFGPCPMTYPIVEVPAGHDKNEWQRNRIELVARKYIGLPYLHKHIPAAGGLDCSNYSAWVFNWGLGIRFSSNVVTQSENAGRRLNPKETLKKSDLLYFWNREKNLIAHIAIYLDDGMMIESKGPNVELRKFIPSAQNFAWARRIIE